MELPAMRLARLLLSSFLLVTTTATMATTATAQNASFTPYSKPCNAQPLSITGVPKLGTTFTVNGISTPAVCTLRFCGCTVGRCNSCQGSVLVFGVARLNAPLGVCSLHVLPLLILGGTGQIPIAVPNNPALFGFKFMLQRADAGMHEVIDANCNRSYPVTAVNGLSDAVEGLVGL
jgi:hypothetical protein